MAFNLNGKELSENIGELSGVVEWLRAEVQRLQGEFEAKGERWRESDRGSSVEDWISQLDDALTGIESGMAELEELGDQGPES